MATPGLFEGYGIQKQIFYQISSAAAFANFDWEFVEGLHVLPGIAFQLR